MIHHSPIKVLLTENIHSVAQERLRSHGYDVELIGHAPKEDELIERLAKVDIIGIRSKTRMTARALEAGQSLLAVGCFCIGTNQVDLEHANQLGVPVFNAPFSNTRSVAELIVAEVIMLSRHLGDKVQELHRGEWQKSARGSHEVRGKTLGIIGYGHIGSQVGVLAEAYGMHVVFHDIVPKLPMGNNRAVTSLDELLAESDFVTLHVPATPHTRMMIGAAELAKMKAGACLLNASRGSVVDLDALAEILDSGYLGGAAIDVYPSEPGQNGPGFESPLRGLANVILTPHIGGSTEEAQEAIGREVSGALARFLSSGATGGAVNFPQLEVPEPLEGRRIVNVHRNVPGVMREINALLSEQRANISAQYLATDEHIGYLIADLDRAVSDDVRERVSALDTSIHTRIL